MSVTRKQYVHSLIDDINELQPSAAGRYGLDNAYGGYRLVFIKNSSGEVDISERVPLKQMADMLYTVREVLKRGRQ